MEGNRIINEDGIRTRKRPPIFPSGSFERHAAMSRPGSDNCELHCTSCAKMTRSSERTGSAVNNPGAHSKEGVRQYDGRALHVHASGHETLEVPEMSTSPTREGECITHLFYPVGLVHHPDGVQGEGSHDHSTENDPERGPDANLRRTLGVVQHARIGRLCCGERRSRRE